LVEYVLKACEQLTGIVFKDQAMDDEPERQNYYQEFDEKIRSFN
jgi:hypothetical protein